MDQGGNGGWIPVGRQQKGGETQGKEVNHGMYTIFVDNLPTSMDAKSLFNLFTKFGIVKNVFIPAKRRIVTNSRFGFVRFDCLVAADIAIQKGNGLLVDDMVLVVKKATVVKNFRDAQSKSRPQIFMKHVETSRNKVEDSFAGQRSFAEVLKGVSPTVAGKAILNLKVNDDGHDWLFVSAIVRLNTEYPTHYIENALKEKGVDQVLVRKGGGRDIVLTFKSQEELKSNICNIKEWLKDWIQFVVEWKPGVHIEQERCVWLRCHGIPLNLWNRSTFNSIGSLWGSVLNLDEDICQPKVFSHTRIRVVTSCMEFINKTIVLECKGKLHPILVCEDLQSDSSNMKHNGMEESSSNDICGSEVKGNVLEECWKENEEDVEVVGAKVHSPNSGMVVNTVVEETKWDVGVNGDNEACTKEVEQREGPIDCQLGEESADSLMEESVHSPKSQVQVSIPGIIRSLSGPRDGLGHGINLEVDLTQAFNKNLNGRGILCLNHPGLGRQTAFVQKTLRIEKKKRKKGQLEGFSSFARFHGHQAATVSKHNSKSVIYRPAAAAIAFSDLSEGATSPNNYLLEEAKATLQLGKSLGINFNGEDDVVLNKIFELEPFGGKIKQMHRRQNKMNWRFKKSSSFWWIY